MGYTNKTSHYELPQYVANDKPSWLGDFNAAMLKIDTVMADNDATAEAANSAATGAQTQVAALSAQLSTIQGQVNTAVDTATTADGNATTAQTVATQANTTAGEAKTLANTANNAANAAQNTANAALPKAGGTMTGDLILNGEPVADNQAATKSYVDNSSTVKIYGFGDYSEITHPASYTIGTIPYTGDNNIALEIDVIGGVVGGTSSTSFLDISVGGVTLTLNNPANPQAAGPATYTYENALIILKGDSPSIIARSGSTVSGGTVTQASFKDVNSSGAINGITIKTANANTVVYSLIVKLFKV